MALERVLIRPTTTVREIDPAADTLEFATADYAGAIAIGGANATSIALGKVGITTTVLGNLQVDGTTTLVDTATLQGDVNLGDGGDTINVGSGPTDTVNLLTDLLVASGVLVDLASSGGYINLPDQAQATATDGTDGYLRLNTSGAPDVLEFLDLGGAVWRTVTYSGGITLDLAYDAGGSGLGRSITADSGAVEITVPDTSNNAGLIINQNDVTNNPNGLEIVNAAVSRGIYINSTASGAVAGSGLYSSLASNLGTAVHGVVAVDTAYSGQFDGGIFKVDGVTTDIDSGTGGSSITHTSATNETAFLDLSTALGTVESVLGVSVAGLGSTSNASLQLNTEVVSGSGNTTISLNNIADSGDALIELVAISTSGNAEIDLDAADLIDITSTTRVNITTALLDITGNTSINGELDLSSKAYYLSGASLVNQPFQNQLASLEYVYSQDDSTVKSGALTHVDSDDQGGNARGVWYDGKFVYLANNAGGLHVYSRDASGNLTHIGSDNPGDFAYGVWGDGKFIYLANSTGGLHVYSVSDAGVLTHVDSDDQGGSAFGVCGDGKFIYLANSDAGISSYSVDSAGNLTFIDSDDQGDSAYGVWCDGNFVYLANFSGGLHVYSVDASGILTHVDSDDQGGAAYGVWGDGKFIYLANNTSGLLSYSVDNAGTLTYIDADDQGDTAKAVWGDGRYIYLANNTGGLLTYTVDLAGNLTYLSADDQGDQALGVFGDAEFLYLANDTGGLHTYSKDNAYEYDKANAEHLFTGYAGFGVDPSYQVDSLTAENTGRAGNFVASATGAVTNYGIYATAAGDTGRAVYGSVSVGTAYSGYFTGGKFYLDGDIYDSNLTTGIPVSELGTTALSGTFTATSIVGALNELKASIISESIWDRDAATGYIYPQTLTDDVGIWGELDLGSRSYYKSPASLVNQPFQNQLASLEYVYSQDDSTVKSGALTHVDSDDQGDNALGAWSDGKFIYLANGTGGLHTYSIDASGNLTHLDFDDPGDTATGVWGDGRFIYLANNAGGLHVYSISSTGVLTHIDSDDPGGLALGVWGDGKFVYLANAADGLHVYSVSDTGILTHIDSDDQGDAAYSVWGDGRFIYLANDSGGLHTYSVSSTGTLTPIDSDDLGGQARGVWGDGRFVYLTNNSGGLHTYTVSNAGVLTHIDSDDPGALARGVWGDGKFIYLANHDGGLHVYTVSNAGVLTHIGSDDQGDLAYSVWGDDYFVYLANYTGGLHVYSKDNAYQYDKANAEHLFTGYAGFGVNPAYQVDSLTAENTGRAGNFVASATGAVTNYGIYASAAGATGYGGYFYASDTTGATNYGIYAKSGGETGYAGYFLADTGGAATNYGIYSQANGATGYGGYFLANSSAAGTNHGIYAKANGTLGRAVYAVAGQATGHSGYFETGLFKVDGVSTQITATSDITLDARGATSAITVNEATSGVLERVDLDGFAATSIVGSLNELKSRIWEDYTLSSATLAFNDTSVSVILVDYTATGPVTITLDSDQVAIPGRTITIKDAIRGGAGTNNITILTEGSETIDGFASRVIADSLGYKTLHSDGSNWYTIGDSYYNVDHGALDGLSDDDHTQYALLAGRVGGQVLYGGTASGDDLTLASTSNATKGKIYLGTSSAYDEVNGRLGIGQTTPTARVHIKGSGTTSSTYSLKVDDSSSAQLFYVRDDGAFAFKGGTVGLAQTGYTTFTNLSTDRTCDADSTTTAELADILGTLIEDLKTKGIISA